MAEEDQREPYQQRYRWVMLALLWLQYATFGLVSRSISPLVSLILSDLSISYSQMGLILGSWQLTYIVASLFAGTIIDKWGVRQSLFFGTVVMSLSAVLRYFSGSFGSFLLVVALFGIGGPLISIGCPKTIAVWFRGKSRGTAVGIYTTGPWIGGLIAFTLTNSVVMPLTGYSWRLTFVSYGLLGFIFALLWLLLARDTRAADTENPNMVQLFARLIKTRNVQVILAAGLLSFAIIHGFTNWLPDILESGGLSPAEAGFTASLPLFASIPAVLVIPRVVPAYLRKSVLALLALTAALALMVSVMASGLLMYAGLVLFGIAGSTLLPLLMLVLMETPEVGSRYMGSAGGMFFCVAEVGGFSGPLLMGALVDIMGTYRGGVVFLASLGLVIFAISFLLNTRTVAASDEP
ncbi:MAG: MFS transporter [Dehalococcoidales bacterium]|nr:MFS transporter [Dehalococcoidales bacterium]